MYRDRRWLVEIWIAIAAAAAGALFSWWLNRPPSTLPIEVLMDQEAALARSHTEAQVPAYGKLFTDDAWIIDVGNLQLCKGKAAIEARFRSLPAIENLQHVLVEPPIIRGDTAFARTTAPFTFTDSATMKPETRTGNEEWLFVHTSDGWKIRSLRYNLPAGR